MTVGKWTDDVWHVAVILCLAGVGIGGWKMVSSMQPLWVVLCACGAVGIVGLLAVGQEVAGGAMKNVLAALWEIFSWWQFWT